MEVRLGELKKYVPLMDYIVQINHKHQDKFKKMRQWILDNKKFSKEYFEKIEKSIIVTYKELSKNKNFPKDLHKVFTVDLCSDDDVEEVTCTTVETNLSRRSKKNADKNQRYCGQTVTIISDTENDDGDVEIIAISSPNVVPTRYAPPKNRERNKSQPNINEEILNRINSTNTLYETQQRISGTNSFNESPPRTSATNAFSESPPRTSATNAFSESPPRIRDTNPFSESPPRISPTNRFGEPSPHINGTNRSIEMSSANHYNEPHQNSNGTYTFSSNAQQQRISVTDLFNKTSQNHTHASDESKSDDGLTLNDCSIFRRRKDFLENINDENVGMEKRHNNAKPKSKKKKKKHKKEKRHRHEKHKMSKDKYIVVDKIILSSSTDDEEACNEQVSNNTSRHLKNTKPHSTTLDIIGHLDEPDLLKIKNKIIAEMETEDSPKLRLKEQNGECGNSSSAIESNCQSNTLNESVLLQMRDALSKTIGWDQFNSDELFKDMDLVSLTDKPPTNKEKQIEERGNNPSTPLNQNVEPTSNIIETTPIINESPNQPIPVIDHAVLRSLLRSETPLQANIRTYPTAPIIQNQYSSALPSPTLTRPRLFHGSQPNNQFIEPHSHMPDINTSMRASVHFSSPLLPVPLQPSINATPQFAVPAVPLPVPAVPLPVPAVPLPVPPVSTQHQLLAANYPGSSNELPSQQYRVASNLIPIQTLGLLQPPTSLPPANLPSHLPSRMNFALNVPTSAVPKPSSLPNSMVTSTSMQVNPAYSVRSSTDLNLTRPQVLKDPRLRKIMEEGSYGNRGQQSQPLTTIHNWIERGSTENSIRTNQNIETSNKKGTTKSSITYGEHVQQKLRKELEDRVMKEKRVDEQRKLEELQRKEQAAKEVEDIERQKQTENIKQILSAHKDDIVGIMKDFNNKDKNNKNTTLSDSRLQPQSSQKPPAKDQQDMDTIAPNITARRKSCTAKDRALKELECTVNGFNKIQDYLSTSDGKRRSSLSARKAIANLLSPPLVTDGENLLENETVSPLKRRPSLSPNTESTQIKRKKINDDGEKESENENEIQNTKERKGKVSFKIRKLSILIKRLSPAEIERLTMKRVQNDTTSVVTTIPSTNKRSSFLETSFLSSCSKPRNEDKRKQVKMCATKSSSASPIQVKNIDCRMTERNCDICVLCNARSLNLTNHYIRIHKKESYLSRLTWEEMDDLQMKSRYAEEVNPPKKSGSAGKAVPRFRIECPFCPEGGGREVIDTFENLRKHFSTHTGEYAFQCKGCGIQKPYYKQIMDHQRRTKCHESGVQTLYQYPSHLMVIYIYICSICNFVQLNKENVFKHLREQHGELHRDHKNVKECTLAAINNEPIERVPLGTIPSSSKNFVDPSFLDQEDNERVVVGNEPLSDDIYASIIKPEPMDDENEFIWDSSRKMPKLSSLCDTNINETREAECLETTALDIKPELDAMFQSILESSISGGEEEQKQENETAPIQETVLENKPDPEKLTLEAVLALLRKYSANTGIRPDLLYQCSVPECGGFFSNFKLWSTHMTDNHNAIIATCPHCVKKKKKDAELDTSLQLSIADFEKHFQTHCLRLYLCFHCDTRCIDEEQIRKHAQHAHTDMTEFRIEQLRNDFTHTYHVLVGKDVLPTRLDFLMQLCNVLRERIQREEDLAEDSEFVISRWPVSKTAAWLEDLNIPSFNRKASKPPCYFKCGETFSNPEKYLDHMKIKHNIHAGGFYNCEFCGKSTPFKSVVTLGKHVFMHSENIYVCCVCTFKTHDRRLLSKHICSEHDKRDVAVLSIHRSQTSVKITIEFVFASGCKTFTTSRVCFCGCGSNDLRVDTFVSHLRRDHLLKMRYFCEYCDERLPHLQLSDEHFRLKHIESEKSLKIRCQIAISSDRQIEILRIQPILFKLSDECYDGDTKSPTVMKTKVDCEHDDDDPIVMEEDEFVAEGEAKQSAELLKKDAPRKFFSCKNILKLM